MEKYKSMPIKVIIADDHKMVREGIKNLLEFDGKIKVIAEAGNGKDCLNLLKDEKNLPDVVLLDINMPEVNGLEVLKSIRKTKMNIKVIILTVHNEIEYLVNAVDMNIDGYILKDSESEVLKNAIYSVCSGETYIQPELIPMLNSRMINRDMDKEKLKSLTRREIEVLKAIAAGLLNKEIATNLGISERTVKNHISNIFKKIDVADRTQAAVFAIKNNIVKLY